VHHDGRTVGEVLLTAPLPHVRDHNLVVLDAVPALDAADVDALLDRELGERGQPHRRLHCDPVDAARWRDDLVARGYETADTIVLRWGGGPLPGVGDVRVEEADRFTAQDVVRALRSQPEDGGAPDPGFVEELATLVGLQHDRGVRVLVARQDDRLVGGVRVFPGEDVAQVEELEVHADVRGHGVGRALLVTALASVADRDLVFLTAEPDEWPAGWYARMGLEPVGRSTGFVRRPTPRTS
jgi:ribosomal protein S18 acetylase RimI-like enzyme